MTFNFDISVNDDRIRLAELRLGSKTIETPFWIINHTQRKKLVRGLNLINNSIPDIPINEIVFDYRNQQEIDSFLTNTQNFENLKSKIKRESRRNTENMFQFRLKDNIVFNQARMMNILKVQVESEVLSIITIPDPNISEFGLLWENLMNSILDQAKNYVNTAQANVYMPIISLNQPNKRLERKIRWLLSKQVPAIGLRAVGSFEKRLPKVTSILNNHRRDIWIHLFDLNKKFLQLSQLHLAPLASVDTISIKKGYARGGSFQPTNNVTGDFPTPEGIPLDAGIEAQPQQLTTSQPRDIFESRALGFLNENEQISNFGHELDCRCPICRKAHYSASELIDLLSQQDRKSLLQVHENFAFPHELGLIKNSVNNNDIEGYYETKSLIINNKERISRRFPIFINGEN